MAQRMTVGSATFGKTARMLAGASLLALAIIAIPGGQAHARENNGGGGNRPCVHPENSGQTLPAGTIWTSKTQNGQVASRYKCDGKSGQWIRFRTSPWLPGPKAPTTGTNKPV